MQSFTRATLSVNCSTTDRSVHVLLHEESDQADCIAEHVARPRRGDERAAEAFRERPSAEAAVSRGPAAGGVGHGLLLGRRTALLAAPRRLYDRGRLCGR